MTEGARSAGEIGCPNYGACPSAGATIAKSIAATKARRSNICIKCLAFLIDRRGLDSIEVKVSFQPPFGNELHTRRPRHAGVIGGAALQLGGITIPLPSGTEAPQRLRQHRGSLRTAGVKLLSQMTCGRPPNERTCPAGGVAAGHRPQCVTIGHWLSASGRKASLPGIVARNL
jgi:hypothetical protein